MIRVINIVGLTAAITTLLLIVASVFVPWWQLIVGTPAIAVVNFSPLNLNFSLFGNIITAPLIWALNMSCLLTLLAGGIIMMIYSLSPAKPYSLKLLGFGYKQPLFAIILFVVEIVGLVISVRTLTGFDFPLMGTGAVGLPAGLAPGGISVSVNVSSAFGWPFFLAIAVAVLCVAARLYHRKMAKTILNNFPATPVPIKESMIS
jgi:hypothetical protein